MNILVIGSGGREHALAWKLAQANQVQQIFVAPGNPGTQQTAKVTNVDIPATDCTALQEFALHNDITLTVVGPEAPLAAGIVDQFQQTGLAIFGPSQASAQLEASKAFSKAFMQQHNIPTAFYQDFTDVDTAIAYIKKHGAPIVVKADGLAAGKGVVVAQTEIEAISAVHDILSDNKFGDAGGRVVIEEFLEGIEASYIVMIDGKNILPMASSQDHKARDEGDKGPNTGGMGAYSPAKIVTPAVEAKVLKTVIQPVVDGMNAAGTPYTGFLYAGLMLNKGNIKVLEFNCRFGDPETQPIMMRLQSNLAELCQLACEKKLDTATIQWDERSTLGVVMASRDYPYSYPKGEVITGLKAEQPNVTVFQAGTKISDGQVVTNGGRVLCVTALGENLETAQATAYAAVKNIHWDSAFYRTDIGAKGL